MKGLEKNQEIVYSNIILAFRASIYLQKTGRNSKKFIHEK